MKSRNLKTVHDLIVTNYRILSIGPGKYLHTFTPRTTGTKYQFVANSTPVLVEGRRYNIGFETTSKGENVVDVDVLSPTDQVNPVISYIAAREFSRAIELSNRQKNDDRVSHSATDGYYWGKKYAWRKYGLVISRDAFDAYLADIKHPFVECVTQDPDTPHLRSSSIAYLDEGLELAISRLVETSVKEGGRYFKSPLYSKRFSIRGLAAITDKK